MPWLESWGELQISANLAVFGLYKQAMISLRVGLELGLLSVYWNLNDDGHRTMQSWLNSSENTPWSREIIKKLQRHENFQRFSKIYDWKPWLDELDELHKYVHSRGVQFSNCPSIGSNPFPSPNFQTFEAPLLETWLSSFRRVIWILSLLHLVKYPLGTIELDYTTKFGINIPAFGGLLENQVSLLEKFIGPEVFQHVRSIAMQDDHVLNLLQTMEEMPDLTSRELDEQTEAMVENNAKLWIENQGLDSWLEQMRWFRTELEKTDKSKLTEERLRAHEDELKKHPQFIARMVRWAKEERLEQPPRRESD